MVVVDKDTDKVEGPLVVEISDADGAAEAPLVVVGETFEIVVEPPVVDGWVDGIMDEEGTPKLELKGVDVGGMEEPPVVGGSDDKIEVGGSLEPVLEPAVTDEGLKGFEVGDMPKPVLIVFKVEGAEKPLPVPETINVPFNCRIMYMPSCEYLIVD